MKTKLTTLSAIVALFTAMLTSTAFSQTAELSVTQLDALEWSAKFKTGVSKDQTSERFGAVPADADPEAVADLKEVHKLKAALARKAAGDVMKQFATKQTMTPPPNAEELAKILEDSTFVTDEARKAQAIGVALLRRHPVRLLTVSASPTPAPAAPAAPARSASVSLSVSASAAPAPAAPPTPPVVHQAEVGGGVRLKKK
jgi:hypothetical protein